jgi:hypothetical protein
LHTQLDALKIVRLNAKPFGELFLRPPTIRPNFGNSSADILERSIGVELSHAPTVPLRPLSKHCVV